LPYPPPKTSLIKTTVNNLKQDRNITPKIMVIKQGTSEETTFQTFLIEEQNNLGPSYAQFLELVQTEMAKL